jgi:prepilin-type processing-associated H-X9-DG protein
MLPVVAPWNPGFSAADPEFPDFPEGPYRRSFLGLIYSLNYLPNADVMLCPSSRPRGQSDPHYSYTFYHPQKLIYTSYGYNWAGFGEYWFQTWHNFSEVKQPSRTYWVADNTDQPFAASLPGMYFFGDAVDDGFLYTWRHGDGFNVLFLDGHVEYLPYKTIQIHHNNGAAFAGGGNPEAWWDLN